MKKQIKRHLNLEGKIFAMLSNSKDRWQIIDVVANSIGLRSCDVFRVINESNKFVLSFDEMELPRIATRERFRKEEPFLNKLIGAFRNRIL